MGVAVDVQLGCLSFYVNNVPVVRDSEADVAAKKGKGKFASAYAIFTPGTTRFRPAVFVYSPRASKLSQVRVCGGWGWCMYVVCCGRFGALLPLRFVYADCCCRSRSTSQCWQACLCRCTTPYSAMPESAALPPLLHVTSYEMGSNQSEKQQALVQRGLRERPKTYLHTISGATPHWSASQQQGSARQQAS